MATWSNYDWNRTGWYRQIPDGSIKVEQLPTSGSTYYYYDDLVLPTAAEKAAAEKKRQEEEAAFAEWDQADD